MDNDDTLDDPTAARAAVELGKGGLVIDGRYRLGRALGQGGMSAVYEATHVGLGYQVALKLSSRGGELVRARMQREAEVAARFEDPGIVRIVDVGVHGSGCYLAMERLHGRDLEALVEQRGPLPVLGACAVVAEIATTCARMHAAQVVHRDLKPANVFLCDGGPVKLIDFGLAKDRGAPGSLTQTGMTMGTAAFLAPEQISNVRHAGPPADCYALGGILLFALTGRVPHDAPSPVEQFAQAIAGEPPDLAELRPEVPPGLVELVAQLLDRDPTKRPSARRVAGALEALIAVLGRRESPAC